MGKIENVIVHCSDSTWGCASIIRQWHLRRGFRDVGYNIIIPNGHMAKRGFYLSQLDGSLEIGRPFNGDSLIDRNEQGAHTLGYNGKSLGICLIGKDQFTSAQMVSLIKLLRDLSNQFQLSIASVIGHYETESGAAQGKTCPNLDMGKIRGML